MLLWEGRFGIAAGAGLDRAGFLVVALAAAVLARVGAVDVALDRAFVVGDVLGAGFETIGHANSPEGSGPSGSGRGGPPFHPVQPGVS